MPSVVSLGEYAFYWIGALLVMGGAAIWAVISLLRKKP